MITENKKKYSRSEVDVLVKDLKSEFEKALMKQKDRIFELKSTMAELEKELTEYKNRESQISKALIFAMQKAEEIEQTAELKYKTELEHLRVFHEKWRNYYNKLIHKYPVDKNISEIKVFNKQLDDIFSGELEDIAKSQSAADSVYEAERKRLSESAVKKVADVLKESEPEERFESIVKTATRKKPAKAKEELAYYKQIDDTTTPVAAAVPPPAITEYLDEQKQKPVSAKVEGKVGRDILGAKTHSAPIPPSSSGFSFEEALNPTQDLEDIMKDLGLIFEGDLDL